jgi:hypothetical protein
MIQTGRPWRNRLTGVEVLNPPDGEPLGIWWQNDGTHWCGLDSNGTGIPDALLPKAHHENALHSISKSIDGLDVRAWRDWCNMLPVDSSLSDSLDEKHEESALGSAMPHLEEICRNPRAHLTVCELREPVSRARRIPPRAIALLSAHSEDWHSRTFRSVRPKAVLSEVTEDEWAIYENRTLRTLRLQILDAFTPRLLALRELLSAMDRSSDGDAFGYRFRINRLCLLLSELLRNQQDRDQLRALVTRLTSIHKSLLGLGSTFLLKTIRQSPLVSSPLRPTNILRDDKRYRKIFKLWHLWERREEEKISRSERLSRLSTAMDRYAAILCARAFSMLQMVCEDDMQRSSAQLFEQGAKPVKLKRGWSFTWREDGSFTLLRPDGNAAIRIVAIPAQIDRLPVSFVAEMASTAKLPENANSSVLILSLGQLDGSPATWPDDLVEWRQTQRHSLTKMPRCLLLEVSPSRLDPVEDVARVLRRVIADVEWPELPIKANLPQGLAKVSHELHHPVMASFSQAPTKVQISEIADRCRITSDEITAIEHRLDEIIQQIQRGRAGHGARELAQEKSKLQAEMVALKGKLVVWESLHPELTRIRSLIIPAMICPCCGHETSNSPQASMFFCSSDSCNTRWGKRSDASGEMRLFLMPNGEDPADPPEGQEPLERYGADFI